MLSGEWAHVTIADAITVRSKLIQYVQGGGTALGQRVTVGAIRGMSDEAMLRLARKVMDEIAVAHIINPPKPK